MPSILSKAKKVAKKALGVARKHKLGTKAAEYLPEEYKEYGREAAKLTGTGVLSKAKKVAKKALGVARKHKLGTKAAEYLPEEYKEYGREAAKLTGTGKRKGQSAERMAELRAMRGMGVKKVVKKVGKAIVKGAKAVNKFAKKTGIVSSALDLAASVEPELESAAVGARLLGYGLTAKNVRGRPRLNKMLDAPVDTRQRGGDINSGGRSMVDYNLGLVQPDKKMGSSLDSSLNQDDVNNLGMNTGYFTNPILTGTSTAFNPNPDDVYNRIQANGGRYGGGSYAVNPFNQSRNSVASLYEPRASISDVNKIPLRK